MACESQNPVAAFFSFLGNPVGTIMDLISKFVLRAAIQIFGSIINDMPSLSGDSKTKAVEISEALDWVVAFVAVGTLLFAAARMALERNGQAGGTWIKGMVRLVLVAGGGTWIATKLATVVDGFSDDMTRKALQDSLSDICTTPGLQSVLLLVVAFLLIIAAIIQLLLLYIRLGVLILLLATLPLAAAASMSDWGGSWWRKHIGWLIAWFLYKPTVAVILFSATAMLTPAKNETISGPGVEGSTNQTALAGVGILLLAGIALPALIKLIVPATGAIGGGNAGSAGTQMAGAGASGAVNMAGSSLSSSGGGRGGGGGGGAPTGAMSTGGGGGGGGGRAAAGGGSAGASRAAAAAGPVGLVAAAAIQTASAVGKAASSAAQGSIADADGEQAMPRR
jgi:hypothetical protein